jgi:hypothetical protein
MSLATPEDLLWITPIAALLTQWTKHTKLGNKVPTQIWSIIVTVVVFAVKTLLTQPDLTSNWRHALTATGLAVLKGIFAGSTSSNVVAFMNRTKEKGFNSAKKDAELYDELAPTEDDIVLSEEPSSDYGFGQLFSRLKPGTTITINVAGGE